jgi:RNA polymerase sigma-70 factor (ECF subfamily)
LSLANHHINQLIELCRQENKQAQMEVYRRYYKAMYNTSVRIVKDSFEAEDIMQDSFLSAFTRLDKLKDNASFGAWLKRIVVNNSIGHYHKNQKANTTGLDDVLYKIEDNTFTNDTNSPEISVDQIKEVISSLKDSYALVLTLNLIEGYDYEEIAEIMKITNGNSRTLISRAKAQLRARLSSQRTH